MIKVESKKLSSEECKVLANITKSARKGTPLESERTVEDVARGIEDLSTNDAFQILIASDENGNIVGWTYYYVAFPLMDFINGFFPLVDENNEPEKIALSLIEAAKRDTVERGQSRLEIELEFPTDAHRAHSEEYVEWYRKCGFKFAAEEVHMKSDLNAIELSEIDPPQGYTLRNFSEVSYDMLEGPGFQTLKNSKEGLFLSMSHTEQKVTLEYFFDKSKSYVEDASLILAREGEIIGFVITRLKDDEPEIGPVGLVPEARGQGLASYLLVRVLESLKDTGSTTAYLDTTITNTPARKLYKKYGFDDVYYKQFYFWSP
ncbi:MAG: GNAT family N-acetyltransferase [Candidatus Thorarchaeota archaeon]|nr:GNAT family N-acetyltransferase [Candidatus Thorarchaeota archaeon]